MAFEQIQDNNAQRVQGGGAPMLSASGSARNQTLATLGLEDATQASATAQALGTLAQDVVGNVIQKNQQRAFIEAYSGAGAGRSVKELREEQPAWESIFGPTATIQGAQLRELNTAVSGFGNEGLSLVSSMKDKDPAVFHKLLSDTVVKHFTGDSITDQLIMQKSLELIPEIAASQYKAHAKYTQQRNLVARQNNLDTSMQTLLTYKKMPKDQQSPEGLAKIHSMLEETLLNSEGMDEDAHRGMVVNNVAKWLRTGNFDMYDMLMKNFVLSDKEDEKISGAEATGVKTHVKGTAAKLKQGEYSGGEQVEYGRVVQGKLMVNGKEVQGTVDDGDILDGELAGKVVVGDKIMSRVPVGGTYADPLPAAVVNRLTLEDHYVITEAIADGNKKIEAEHDFDAGLAEAELTSQADQSTNRLQLTENLLLGMKTYPHTIDKDFVARSLSKFDARLAKGNEDSSIDAAFINPTERILDKSKQQEAWRRHDANIRAKFANDPKKGEAVVLDYWSTSQYGLNQDLTDQLNDQLSTPLNDKGKPNEQFEIGWTLLKELYKRNPEKAIMQIPAGPLRAKIHGAIRMVEMGRMTEAGVKASILRNSELDSLGVERNPEVMKAIREKVADLTKGNFTRLIPFVTTDKKVFNTREVEAIITSNADAIAQYNGVSADSAYELGELEFKERYEYVAGRFVPREKDNVPLSQTMGITSTEYQANDAFKYIMKRQGITNGNVQILRGIAIIEPCDDNGIATGEKSWQLPLKTIGKLFNDGVVIPNRSEFDKLHNKIADVKVNAAVRSIVHRAKTMDNKELTFEEGLAIYNRRNKLDAEFRNRMHKQIGTAVTEAVGAAGPVIKHMLDQYLPDPKAALQGMKTIKDVGGALLFD